MLGDEAYKKHWATDNRQCSAVTIYPNRLSMNIEQLKIKSRAFLKEQRLKHRDLNEIWIKISKYI